MSVTNSGAGSISNCVGSQGEKSSANPSFAKGLVSADLKFEQLRLCASMSLPKITRADLNKFE